MAPSKPKVLLVEDNDDIRKLYKIFLTNNHLDVEEAIDGEDGLAKAKSFKPDVIFLDIMMPKMDGFQVLRALRSDSSYGCQEAKIIILTNLGDSSNISKQVRADMDGYVIKSEIELRDLLRIATTPRR